MTEKLDMDRVVADKAWGLGLWVKATPSSGTMSRYEFRRGSVIVYEAIGYMEANAFLNGVKVGVERWMPR